MKLSRVVRIVSLPAALALLAGCAGSSYYGGAVYSSGYHHYDDPGYHHYGHPGYYHHSHHHSYRSYHHYYDSGPAYYRSHPHHSRGSSIRVNDKLPIDDSRLRELVQ